MRRLISIVAITASVLTAGAASAQQLVYTPINPQFGGNPGNTTILETDATAQNQYSAAHTKANQTQAQLFASQLQSILLSDLANQVSQAIFGANAQNSGKFSFGGETVSFQKDLSNTTIVITDVTGAQTTIVLPNTTTVR
jgi:curli production assembly/transport component CsgF